MCRLLYKHSNIVLGKITIFGGIVFYAVNLGSEFAHRIDSAQQILNGLGTYWLVITGDDLPLVQPVGAIIPHDGDRVPEEQGNP